MDKRLIERAIIKKLKDVNAKENQELADMYLQKIIQLPVDLPDPSNEESSRFLKGQLGVSENENKTSIEDNGSSNNGADEREAVPDNRSSNNGVEEREAVPGNRSSNNGVEEIEAVPDNRSSNNVAQEGKVFPGFLSYFTSCIKTFFAILTPDKRSSSNIAEEREALQQNSAAQDVAINVQTPSGHTNLPERSVRTQAPSQTDGDGTITRKEKTTSYTLIREMLFVRYSRGEENAFLYFQGLATGCRKHPREWKRLLNYHRLVWYIFSVNEEAKNFYGWQVELITWIFVCWEWQGYMNLVIKKWKEIDLKMNAPSLVMIIDHLMEERERENVKVKITEPEDTSKSTDDFQNSENASAERLGNVMEQKLDALEKSLAELKKEMKQFKEAISHELKKDKKNLKNM
ncbi:hypothetical protein SUGI_0409170 [Cryptomeria japonica]|nr:hypothetical protein SUGI_0409170 [Cryptomeria japonica]